MTPTQELDEKLSMDSHAASYTGVLHSFFAAAITAHLMLEDWRLEPFNHLWLALHPLLLQWYHQRSHSQHMQAMKPLAQAPLAQVPLPQALQQQEALDSHKSQEWLVLAVVAETFPKTESGGIAFTGNASSFTTGDDDKAFAMASYARAFECSLAALCKFWALLSCRWANGTRPGTGCIAIVGFSYMSSLLLQSFISHLLCSAQPFLCFRSGHRCLWAIASLWLCTVTNRLSHWTSSISWSCSIWSCSIWNWGYSCSDGIFVGAPNSIEALLEHPPAIFIPHRLVHPFLASPWMHTLSETLGPFPVATAFASLGSTTPITLGKSFLATVLHLLIRGLGIRIRLAP